MLLYNKKYFNIGVETIVFNMKEKIAGILTNVGVPFAFVQKAESAFPFVVYNISHESGNRFYDDEESVTKFQVTINIFSKGDYENIKNLIVENMLIQGFEREDIPSCQFLEEISVYNQPMFFSYYYEGE